MSELQGSGLDGARPQPSVVLYHAPACSLCEKARQVLRDSGSAFDEVDISGNEDLEAKYREWLPVVEVDGERAFVYFVDGDALRRRLRRLKQDQPEAGG